MSSFRRAPNVSQYIADLNSVSPRDSSPREAFLNDDLDLFATTDFIDFDMGESLSNLPSLRGSIDVPSSAQTGLGFHQPSTGTDWNNNFNFSADFTSFPSILDTTSAAATSYPQLPTHEVPVTHTPITPSPHNNKTSEKRKLQASVDAAVPTTAQPTEAGTPTTDGKHAETARVAAEEDKRRRNTAASARFRIKKKQREADLEKRAKEMTEKAAMLETKVQQLEMENKWLKSLITEKEGKGEIVVGSLESGVAGGKVGSEAEGRTDGVGTKRQKVEV